ncbi:MAG: response regulator [Candidatus Scalindua sp.]
MTKGKILVVDDEIRLCRVMELMLCKRGYDVRSVYSGIEAIELIKKVEFDLVLCDYVMPKITGYDVAIFLNVLEKKPKVGIITGWNDLISVKQREDMKIDFIVEKPVKFSELTKLINGTLDAI